MTPMNLGIDEKLYHYLLRSVEEAPFYTLLGIKLVSIGPGQAVFTMKAQQEHTNSIGLLQGGLISSLADTAMGVALRSLGMNAATVDMSIGFTASARLGDTLRAEGRVVKAGREILFAETRVMAGEQLIAYCKGTFYKIADLDY
ncbi:MAG: PaaI family thioesterase [Syntrophomonadaceae bacterium]|nr:PaaI family thioesterase [Syntrophomonadaceae bacterium]